MSKEYNPKYKRDKSKDRFEKIKAEVQEKFDKEHTFKPSVNYSNVFSGSDKVNKESKEEVYKRLSTPKSVEITKRLKEKELNERKILNEECTFKPNLCEIDEATLSREKVETRLYKLAEQMKEKREKLKREYQDNLIKDYSFNPKIDENSKQLVLKYENKPLHERVS
jgi:hypothetical protein